MDRLLILALLLLLVPAAVGQGSNSSSDSFLNNGSLDPRDYIEIKSSEPEINNTSVFDRERGVNLPKGYIALLLAFLGIIIYSVDMDPFFMVIIIFLLLFSGLVYYLRLPLHLIPVAIMLVIGVKYLR